MFKFSNGRNDNNCNELTKLQMNYKPVDVKIFRAIFETIRDTTEEVNTFAQI